jgi:hypothetical protein
MDIKTELEVQTKFSKLRMEQDRQYKYNLTLRSTCETAVALLQWKSNNYYIY